MLWSWDTWQLDLFTWLWIVWIAWFAILETVTLATGSGNELTAHLRPLFLSMPLTWFLALGLWLWIGVHFLTPTIELWLSGAVGGP